MSFLDTKVHHWNPGTWLKFLKITVPIVSYLERIASFLSVATLVGPGDRVIKDPCLLRLAASNIAARSGNELDRRRPFWNDALLKVCGFPPPSSCAAMSLRIPNCFRNHFLVSGLRGGFIWLSLSRSFRDCTFELLVWFSGVSSFMTSSCGRTSFAGLFFFVDIVVLWKKRKIL